MNAVELFPLRLVDLARRIDADLGRPSLRAVVVSASSVEPVASRIAGRAVAHIEHPHDVASLLRLLRNAADGLVVISGLDELSEEEWRRLDLLRSKLSRNISTVFVLTARSFERLSISAPNLASWIDSAFTLLDGAGPTPEEAAQADFDRLSRIWLEETMVTSSLTRMVNHPAYQEIIRMGPRMIPPILRDLEREPNMWGPALHAITKATPVPVEDAGKVARVAATWLRWAKDHGYAW